jgi:hypothetical protein
MESGGKREYNEAIYQIILDFKKAYDSVEKKILYNVIIEFGMPMEVFVLRLLLLLALC